MNHKGSFPDDRWPMYAQELSVLVVAPGGALWKDGNPHFADLWTAVEGMEVPEEMDLTILRDKEPETSAWSCLFLHAA